MASYGPAWQRVKTREVIGVRSGGWLCNPSIASFSLAAISDRTGSA
jgi:hypothetical protein